MILTTQVLQFYITGSVSEFICDLRIAVVINNLTSCLPDNILVHLCTDRYNINVPVWV